MEAGQTSNGPPWGGAPLLAKLVMAHHTYGAPLLVLKKKIKKISLVVTHRGCGAPLVFRV